MNKKELIERIEGLKNIFGSKAEYSEIDAAIELISELDEPEKAKVPRFVADWIANVKRNGFKFRNSSRFYEEIVSSDDAYRVMYYILKESIAGEAIRIWVNANRDTFARAWLDGYEVEKEKRYLVKMKELEAGFNLLNRHKTENYWIFSSKDESITYQVCHTRKELEEAGFGWVFDCQGIEIKEVE